jgi:hypothetical protein
LADLRSTKISNIYDYDYDYEVSRSPGHADLENSDVAVTVQTQR